MGQWLSTIQYWINCVFNIEDQQSAPIIITLLVFIAGWIVTGIGVFMKNLATRKTIRQQVYPLFESLIVDLRLQASLNRETAEGLNLLLIQSFQVSKVDFYQIEVLNSIGYSKILNSIFLGIENFLGRRMINRKEKKKAFAKCWKAAISASHWQEKTLTDIVSITSQYNYFNERRNTSIVEFEKDFVGFNMKSFHPQADRERDIVRQIDKVRNDWRILPNPVAPKTIHENLVEPVLKICENCLLVYPQRIRFALQDAAAHYENMALLIQNSKKQYNKYADQFESYAKNLEGGLSRMRQFR